VQTTIRSALAAYYRLLDERLSRPLELAAQTPLLAPDILIAGNLGLVGAHREEDAERVLLMTALDAAPNRRVLVVSQDRYWTEVELIALARGVSSNDIVGSDEFLRFGETERVLASMSIEVSDAIVHNGSAEDVSRWLRDHENGLAILPAAWPASLCGDEDRAAAFVRRMKAIARETSGTILIPWKLNASRRNDPRPMLRDLAVSGAAEDDADLVVLFHRSEYGVEIRLEKNRHGTTGYLFDSRDLDSVH
jgi:hypothetical protein